jgi:hypothetical protein
MRLIVYAPAGGSPKSIEHETATMIANHIMHSPELFDYILGGKDTDDEVNISIDDKKTG